MVDEDCELYFREKYIENFCIDNNKHSIQFQPKENWGKILSLP